MINQISNTDCADAQTAVSIIATTIAEAKNRALTEVVRQFGLSVDEQTGKEITCIKEGGLSNREVFYFKYGTDMQLLLLDFDVVFVEGRAEFRVSAPIDVSSFLNCV